MPENNTNTPAKSSMAKNLVRLLVVLLALAAVGGVWLFKNRAAADRPQAENWPALHVTERFTLAELAEYGVPVLLDFGTETCGPCKAMAADLAQVYTETAGRAIVLYIDLDLHPWVLEEFPIQVTPTQVFYDAGGFPYVPSDAMMGGMTLYQYRDTGAHGLTVHEGILGYDTLMQALTEMGMQTA